MRLAGVVVALLGALVASTADAGARREPVDASTADVDPPYRFPDGFFWGTATAAGQVEPMDGSDWDAFALKDTRWSPEQLRQRTGYDTRYASDLAFARSMGTNAYRFSISWERLFPTADATTPDPAGVAFYRAVLDECAADGLEPMVTLFHFTTPAWFWEEKGGKRGWERDDALELWDRYVDAVVSLYGDRVRWWITLNEPMVYLVFGYLDGTWPPEQRRGGPADIAPLVRVLLDAHAHAYARIHRDGREAHVGIAEHVRAFQPLRNGNPLDRITAATVDESFNWDFLDAIATGRLQMTHTRVDEPVPGLAQDFVGLNYYGRYYIKTHLLHPAKFDVLEHDPKGGDVTNELGWAQYPRGLRDAIDEIDRRYHLPVAITENGTVDHELDDRGRQRQLVRDLREVWLATHDGARVLGYFHWSLTDNFEWAEAFGPRFGLAAVDYDHDLARTPRESAALYARIIREGLSPELIDAAR